MNMSLGSYLKRLRQQNGLTIKQVVDMSQGILDKTTVSRIERDERGVSLKAAYAFSRIYNVSLNELCEYVLGRKIDVEHVPFETSQDERVLLEGYRLLSRQRRKSIHEVVRGLSLARQPHSSTIARKRLRNTLITIESDDL
ncbi:helix-turn-helix transcriptional regulator [bacterium]